MRHAERVAAAAFVLLLAAIPSTTHLQQRLHVVARQTRALQLRLARLRQIVLHAPADSSSDEQ
eukprot:gene45665-52057_t